MNKSASISKPPAPVHVISCPVKDLDKNATATVVSEDEVSKSSLEEVQLVLKEWEQEKYSDDGDDIAMSHDDDDVLLQTDAVLLDSVSLDFDDEGDESNVLSTLTSLPEFPMNGVGSTNNNVHNDYDDDSQSSSCLYSKFERQLHIASMRLAFSMRQSQESRICYSVALSADDETTTTKSNKRSFDKYCEKVEESREQLKRRNVLEQVEESRDQIKQSLEPMVHSSTSSSNIPMEIEF